MNALETIQGSVSCPRLLWHAGWSGQGLDNQMLQLLELLSHNHSKNHKNKKKIFLKTRSNVW